MKCPYCGSHDVRVFGRCMTSKLHRCEACGAQETGAYAADEALTDIEAKTGWYDPRPRHSEYGLGYMQTRGAS